MKMETIDTNDISLFSEYIKEKNELFSDELHIPYLIGSPIKLFKDNAFSKKNDALLPVLILVKKLDGTIGFEETVFNWKSIDLLQTYSKITSGGQLTYLGDNEKYKDLFTEEKIGVDIDKVVEINLKDVISKYPFYKKLSPKLIEKYKNERFLSFSYKQTNYVIPAIEVVRYFYCYSLGDSLKQAIFHPSGMNLLVKKCTRHTHANRYDLYLQTLCKSDDNKKVFYFTYDKIFMGMFHNIFYQYKNDDNQISAQFPFKDNFSMLCKTLKLSPDSNDVLITKVIDSSMMNNFFTETKIDLHVHHPQAKEKEKNTGKRDKTKDRKRKVPKTKPSGFNDKLSTAASIPAQVVTSEENTDYFPEEEITSKIETNGQREELGGQTIFVPTDMDGFSTQDGSGKGTSAQKIVTSGQKLKIETYPAILPLSDFQDFNKTLEIIKEFKIHVYNIDSYSTFSFPDKIDGKKLAISYLDTGKTIKRNYMLIKLSKGNQEYIYLDVEAKTTNKEILFFINQKIKIAHKCIYQQIHYGNHKWLSKESLNLEENIDFIRIRHSSTPKLLVENIMNKINT